ncbi:hypothetical protein Q8A73_002992 [Channa argus]|nr:hypothetical protein Q8A73_002992 [Channa argus]
MLETRCEPEAWVSLCLRSSKVTLQSSRSVSSPAQLSDRMRQWSPRAGPTVDPVGGGNSRASGVSSGPNGCLLPSAVLFSVFCRVYDPLSPRPSVFSLRLSPRDASLSSVLRAVLCTQCDAFSARKKTRPPPPRYTHTLSLAFLSPPPPLSLLLSTRQGSKQKEEKEVGTTVCRGHGSLIMSPPLALRFLRRLAVEATSRVSGGPTLIRRGDRCVTNTEHFAEFRVSPRSRRILHYAFSEHDEPPFSHSLNPPPPACGPLCLSALMLQPKALRVAPSRGRAELPVLSPTSAGHCFYDN